MRRRVGEDWTGGKLEGGRRDEEATETQAGSSPAPLANDAACGCALPVGKMDRKPSP